MQLEQMYQEIILDHYRHPHGRGLREPFEAQVHHVNPTCGDEITLRVHLVPGPDGGAFVEDVSYEGQGCSISQASASVLFDQVVGSTIEESFAMEAAFLELMQSRGAAEPDEDVLGDAVAFVGVSKYPARVKCALLSWMAFKDAALQSLPGALPDAELVVEPASGPDAAPAEDDVPDDNDRTAPATSEVSAP